MPDANSADTRPPDKPLDVDGVAAMITGTALFTIGLVVLLFFRGPLRELDATWWIWVCAAGALMGLGGAAYVVRRRTAYRAAGKMRARR